MLVTEPPPPEEDPSPPPPPLPESVQVAVELETVPPFKLR